MNFIFLAAFLLLVLIALFQFVQKQDRRRVMHALRWILGGLTAVLAVFLLIIRRFDLALFVGAGAFQILRSGRIGRFSLDGLGASKSNTSKVSSYRFAMELDHDTGAVSGRVLNGTFAGWDLMDLGEDDTRQLLVEIEDDADSLSLFESWLDANRAGWREYFAEQDSGESFRSQNSGDPLAEAYDVLGLKPGATADEIRAAHRELMKSLHPDRGGSSYLASKINQARDILLGL
jgi:DnaJ-domain-containing protein 1